MSQFNAASVVISTLVLATASANAFANVSLDDRKYFTVTSVQVEEIAEESAIFSPELNTMIEPARESALPEVSTPSTPSMMTAINPVVIEKIINIGMKVWQIIEKNRPVVGIDMSAGATATPVGIDHWQELAGWQMPQFKTYKITYKNGYGMNVVDFSYRVIFTYGGNYQGRGKYLAQVTAVPANVSVVWGYTFNAKASVPVVTNIGSTGYPVASAQLQIDYTLDTVMVHRQEAMNYYVTGEGLFKAMQ